jgi:hypothetical protein
MKSAPTSVVEVPRPRPLTSSSRVPFASTLLSIGVVSEASGRELTGAGGSEFEGGGAGGGSADEERARPTKEDDRERADNMGAARVGCPSASGRCAAAYG